MSSELAEITGSSFDFEHEGKIWRMSPIEPMDLGELETHLQKLPFERMRDRVESLGDACTEELRARMYETAVAEAEKLTYTSYAAAKFMNSIPGVAFLLWLSLRKNHQDLTLKDCTRMLTLKNLDQFKEKLDEVSGLKVPHKLKKKPMSKKRKQVRKRKR